MRVPLRWSRSKMGWTLALAAWLAAVPASAGDEALDRGLEAVRGLAGCYLVDYSFVEVEALKPGYLRDPRVYDVNADKSVKEWITAETISPRRVRLQRILFAADLAGCGTPGEPAAPSIGGLGARRRVPLRLRRPADLARARPAGHTRAVDAADYQSGRRAALSVRGAVEDRRRLCRVVVRQLLARSRPRDARHGQEGLQHAGPADAHRRVRGKLARAPGQREDDRRRRRAHPARPRARERPGT